MIVFYTRKDCCLCHDALAMLRKYKKKYSLTIQLRDVDDNAETAEKYGEMVPVIEIDGRPRFWGRVNEAMLERAMRKL